MRQYPITNINRSERRAMLALLLIALCYLYWPRIYGGISNPEDQQRDSARAAALLKVLRSPKPLRAFDPNRDDLEMLVAKGLDRNVAENIVNYREKLRPFKTRADLLDLYALDSQTYLLLKDSVLLGNAKEVNEPRLHINRSSAVVISERSGVPEYLSDRIVKYRDLLGGFYAMNQLREVYGIKERAISAIRKNFYTDSSVLESLDLDSMTFKQLLRHPYIEYEQVVALFSLRDSGAIGLQEVRAVWPKEKERRRILPYIDIHHVE